MAGKRRTKVEWEQLIAEFERGDENIKAFCLRHSLTPSNFYKRRSTRANASASAFVAARRAAPSASSVAVQIDEIVIRCDTQTPVTWVSALVTALRG